MTTTDKTWMSELQEVREELKRDILAKIDEDLAYRSQRLDSMLNAVIAERGEHRAAERERSKEKETLQQNFLEAQEANFHLQNEIDRSREELLRLRHGAPLGRPVRHSTRGDAMDDDIPF
jgi:hypothetical protein